MDSTFTAAGPGIHPRSYSLILSLSKHQASQESPLMALIILRLCLSADVTFWVMQVCKYASISTACGLTS